MKWVRMKRNMIDRQHPAIALFHNYSIFVHVPQQATIRKWMVYISSLVVDLL